MNLSIKSYFLFLCLQIVLCSPLRAQEIYEEPNAERLTTIKFRQLNNNLIVLNVFLNDITDTLHFILDTGNSGISLDTTLIEKYGLTTTPSSLKVKGIGGSRKVSFLNNQKITLNGLSIDGLNFHINDYHFLEEIYGEKIDGVLGYAMLSRYIFKIDYDSLSIEIFSPGYIKYPRGGYILRPQINNLPTSLAQFSDNTKHNSRFLLDIGGDVCIMVSKEFADDSLKLKRKRKVFEKEGEGIGGKVTMMSTVISSFKIGAYKFRKVPVLIFDDAYNVTGYPVLAGIVGNDILRRFNLVINYPKRIIHIKPNSYFFAPFDYSYVGTDIFLANKQILFGPVYKNSPAYKAGIKENDIIMSINNDYSQNLLTYKALLQNTNKVHKILINRNGELLTKHLKVISIL